MFCGVVVVTGASVDFGDGRIVGAIVGVGAGVGLGVVVSTGIGFVAVTVDAVFEVIFLGWVYSKKIPAESRARMAMTAIGVKPFWSSFMLAVCPAYRRGLGKAIFQYLDDFVNSAVQFPRYVFHHKIIILMICMPKPGIFLHSFVYFLFA